MPEFIKGQELSRIFYIEAVKPILEEHFPNLRYTAGRFGAGSDVLGFDTPMSRDHDWGPSVHLILHEEDMLQAKAIWERLATDLPREIRGYSTHFGQHDSDGTQVMDVPSDGRINHRVRIMTLRKYIWQALHWDIDQALTVADWLSFPSQVLRTIAVAWVHDDKSGEWVALRDKLSWYPHNLWLYLMASSWGRIGQEDHLHGRTGYVGDEVGSQIIASRLVRDMMFLCFLQEKHYAPYPKWFGSGFQQLNCAEELTPIFKRVHQAQTWQAREDALVAGYEYLARRHNALNVTETVSETAEKFHNRPFRVICNNGISDKLLEAITDPQVKALQDLPSLIGSIDHFSDSTDLRSYVTWREKVKAFYE